MMFIFYIKIGFWNKLKYEEKMKKQNEEYLLYIKNEEESFNEIFLKCRWRNNLQKCLNF